MKHFTVRCFYEDDNGHVIGYDGGFSNVHELKERFQHFNIRRDNISHTWVDKEPLTEEQIDKMFHKLNKTL